MCLWWQCQLPPRPSLSFAEEGPRPARGRPHLAHCFGDGHHHIARPSDCSRRRRWSGLAPWPTGRIRTTWTRSSTRFVMRRLACPQSRRRPLSSPRNASDRSWPGAMETKIMRRVHRRRTSNSGAAYYRRRPRRLYRRLCRRRSRRRLRHRRRRGAGCRSTFPLPRRPAAMMAPAVPAPAMAARPVAAAAGGGAGHGAGHGAGIAIAGAPAGGGGAGGTTIVATATARSAAAVSAAVTATATAPATVTPLPSISSAARPVAVSTIVTAGATTRKRKQVTTRI